MIRSYIIKVTALCAQWTGENEEEINQFVPNHLRMYENDGLTLGTVEGHQKVRVDDWIVRNPDGTFRVVSPVDFEKNFVLYEEDQETPPQEDLPRAD